MRPEISLREDFDGERLRRLARRTKDAAQARRLLALASIYDGGSRSDAARLGNGRHPISTALFVGVCAIWRNGFGKSFAFR
jgi:hypothetical protein